MILPRLTACIRCDGLDPLVHCGNCGRGGSFATVEQAAAWRQARRSHDIGATAVIVAVLAAILAVAIQVF